MLRLLRGAWKSHFVDWESRRLVGGIGSCSLWYLGSLWRLVEGCGVPEGGGVVVGAKGC